MATPTQAQLDAIEAAYFSGNLTVRHGETSITYRTRAEMKAIINEMKAALAGRQRRSVAKFNKGL